MILATLAVTVALVVLFCIAAAAFLVGQPFFEEHRQHVAMALGAFGVLFLLAGCGLARRRAKSKDASKGIVIFDLRYWGPMLVLFGSITLFIHSLDLTGLLQQLRAMLGQEKVMVAAKEPDPTNAPTAPPVVFPVLKLQGLIFKQNQPIVIIGGESYGIGESVDGILIKNITRDGVTLELSNEVKVLSFGGAATPGIAVTPAGK